MTSNNEVPPFPAAKLDAYKTASPEKDGCIRCQCVRGVEPVCDKPEICSCHWSDADVKAMGADETLADRKEEL